MTTNYQIGDVTTLGTITRIYTIHNTVLFEVRSRKGRIQINVRLEDF